MAAALEVRPVALTEFSAVAAGILQLAWKPPCVAYTERYLVWQCGFPSLLPPIVLAGYRGEEPLAFVAVTGRPSSIGPIYTSSFLSAVPGAPPALAAELVLHLSRLIKASGELCMNFAIPGSFGEKIMRCSDIVGLKRTPLGEYQVHSAMSRRPLPGWSVEAVSGELWAEKATEFRDEALLAPVFDQGTLHHLSRDPAGREFLLARLNSTVYATAMLSQTISLTDAGTVSIPTLHCVRLREQCAEAVRALLDYAGEPGTLVNVPNVCTVHPDTRRAAGLRPTRSLFKAVVAGLHSRPLPLTFTEFEIA